MFFVVTLACVHYNINAYKRGIYMKKIMQKFTLLAIPLLVIGCAAKGSSAIDESVPEASSAPASSVANSSNTNSSNPTSKPGSSSSSAKPSSTQSSRPSSSSAAHVHTWSTAWEYDGTTHWHPCTDPTCNGKSGIASHELSADFEPYDPTVLPGETATKGTGIKAKQCKTCGYKVVDANGKLPELRFTFDPNDENANFATVATKGDLSRPKVNGKYSLSNCDEKFQFTDAAGYMKVRGNQTAGWSKKGFKIKFDKGQTFLGLNGNKKFKEWVLLADAKDTTLSRTALGLYVSRAVAQDDPQVWASDFTPVNVYLNDQYWGFYYLAEQKEAKTGRVSIPVVAEKYVGTDIGYTFELDHYADSAGSNGEASEFAKGADGDPTFRVKYSPRMEQGRPSGPLAAGQICTYTMLSDITDGPMDSSGNPTEHWQADYSSVNSQSGVPNNNATKTSNSEQLSFIRNRVEALYQVLYYAAMENKAKDINDNNQVIDSSKTVKEMMTKHFDLDAWVDGFIINAYSCPPDLGYSSFYMTFDNSATGDKRLRFDVPWDFDSNFGNRNNFIVNADELYVDNTYNTWIYLLSKISFFTDMVKAKWNKLREGKVFENMLTMVKTYYTVFDAEIQKNHQKWPQNDAAHQPPNNFDEIRNPYKNPSQYKEAEAETISWCAKRVNFLEKKWGNNRANLPTT